MKLETTRLGQVEVPDSAMVRFEQGLPGFETLKEFALLDLEEGLPYKWLQSLEESEISMLVTDPFVFYPEYEWQLPEMIEQELKLKESSDVRIWSIVTLSHDLQGATINLLAPIVLNEKERIAKQHILHDKQYHTKHPLLRSGSGQVGSSEMEG